MLSSVAQYDCHVVSGSQVLEMSQVSRIALWGSLSLLVCQVKLYLEVTPDADFDLDDIVMQVNIYRQSHRHRHRGGWRWRLGIRGKRENWSTEKEGCYHPGEVGGDGGYDYDGDEPGSNHHDRHNQGDHWGNWQPKWADPGSWPDWPSLPFWNGRWKTKPIATTIIIVSFATPTIMTTNITIIITKIILTLIFSEEWQDCRLLGRKRGHSILLFRQAGIIII